MPEICEKCWNTGCKENEILRASKLEIRTTGKTTGIRLFRKGKELGREHFERMFTE